MAIQPFMGPLAGRQLRHIIIPGSHDAGLARDYQANLSRLSNASITVTQSVGVGAQAAAGSRFFDVRIQSIGGTLTSFHTAPNPLRHVPLVKKIKATKTDTRTFGASGQAFHEILDELRAFVAGSTEFVIIRLSHLKDSAEIFQQLWTWIGLQANSQYVYRGIGNLARHPVGQLGGHVVLVIESGKFKHSVVPPGGGAARIPGQADGFHKFYQSKGGNLPTVTDGLCVCGEFSNKKNLDDILNKQITNYTLHDQHKNHVGDQAHLYSLYWTATGGNIEQNTNQQLVGNFQKVRKLVNDTVSSNWSAKIRANQDRILTPGIKHIDDEFRQENIARTKFAVKSASIPNIILYDFVNDVVSQEIINLNNIVSA
jgi:hypothetical protein